MKTDRIGSRRGFGVFSVFVLLTMLAVTALMQQTYDLVMVLREQGRLLTTIQQEDRCSLPVAAELEVPSAEQY